MDLDYFANLLSPRFILLYDVDFQTNYTLYPESTGGGLLLASSKQTYSFPIILRTIPLDDQSYFSVFILNFN